MMTVRFDRCTGRPADADVFAPRLLRKLFTWLCLVNLAAAALVSSGCRTAAPASRPQSPRTHEPSVRPGVNDEYADPDVNEWTERFEREAREIYANRRQIIDVINARPGMVIADVGAGTGFMTTLLANAVGPDGKVFAVDIVPEFLDLIRSRAEEKGLTNVHTILCTEDSVELPPGSIDLALLCDVYHHLEYPKSTLETIHQALKPGGELIVIDFIRIPGKSRQWVLEHVRAGQEDVLNELRASGFELTEEKTNYDFLAENYIMRFRKSG